MEVRNSGRNPTDVLRDMYKNGQISDAQLSQIQQQGRMFGVRISDAEIAKIKAIDEPTGKKFGGWF